MRRTPLNRMSAKKRKEIAETKEIRKIELGTICEGCLAADATETHEITAGAHRHRAVHEQLAQMKLCHDCHQKIQGTPYAEQIAAKTVAIVNIVNNCHGSRAVWMSDVIQVMVRQLEL